MKNDARNIRRHAFAIILSIFCLGHMQAGALEESDVFDWWDNGIISQDEAEDILNLLEKGDTQEACALAEVYAQEVCPDTEAPQTMKKAAKKKSNGKDSGKNAAKASHDGAELFPSGFILWKTRIDSTGHRVSDRKELQVTFYRYTLRLGSQNLLTYRAQGYEAHFGNISTRELHGQIPMDTLMGMSVLFPLGHFRLGGAFDTSLAKSARAEFTYGKSNIAASYWNIGGENSVAVQAGTNEALLAAWYQMHQKAPIVKMQIHSRETSKLAREHKRDYTVSWNTTAYFHGTQVPEYSRLSSTILKNKLWSSQNITLSGTGESQTKVGATASLFAPIDADTLRARFKLVTETGPEAIHARLSATCLDATTRCMQDDLAAKITSQHGTEKTFTADASAKTRFNREKNGKDGLGAPRLEAGIAYTEKTQNKIRMAVILPKGDPREAITLRNESKISSNWLQCTLIVDFKQTRTRKMHPSRAHVQAKMVF